jgi:hypothetical protein
VSYTSSPDVLISDIISVPTCEVQCDSLTCVYIVWWSDWTPAFPSPQAFTRVFVLGIPLF